MFGYQLIDVHHIKIAVYDPTNRLQANFKIPDKQRVFDLAGNLNSDHDIKKCWMKNCPVRNLSGISQRGSIQTAG